jgi:membrane protein
VILPLAIQLFLTLRVTHRTLVSTGRRLEQTLEGLEAAALRAQQSVSPTTRTMAGGLLVLVAASALIAGGGVGAWIAGRLGIRSAYLSVMRWLRWPVLGVAFMTAAGLGYRFLPDVRQRFVCIAPGAAAGALAWVLATWGFGRYVAAFGSYDVTYGSLGGVMILLTWLYLSGFIALAGGQLNAALEARRVARG